MNIIKIDKSELIFVIAGSHEEFIRFLYDTGRTQRYTQYVTSIEQLLGLWKVKFIFVGTYYWRKDIRKIIRFLKSKPEFTFYCFRNKKYRDYYL